MQKRTDTKLHTGIIITITWILRILTGVVFVYSGFVKGVDPWGTLYKFEDYMQAMNLPVWPNLLLTATFLLCAYEFCVGIFLLLGCFRRSAPICAALFMGIMLPLTLWIAISDPVADCGCFGDALVISNWATFWKNVVLSAAVVWLIIYNPRLRWIIRPHLQWVALLASAGFVVTVGLAGYVYQPLIDFRPYPVGSFLISDDNSSDAPEEEITLVYSRDGVEKVFSIDDELPDESEGWIFVRREIKDAKPVNTTGNKREQTQGNLRLWDNDEEDVTSEVLDGSDRQILLLMPEMGNVSVATTWQINSMKSWAEGNGISMVGIVSGSRKEIEDWQDLSLADYPIYTADDTEIKMLARGNPAVVYIDHGEILWKTTLRALGTKDFKSASASKDPMHYGRDNRVILRNITGIYIAIMGLLIVLSFVPNLGRMFFSSKS